MKILAIVPAYNEAKNIERVINNIAKEEPKIDIVIINDGSDDETGLIAEKTKKATVINLPHNLGIGGTIQTGFKFAERKNYDVIIRTDGDGQHQSEEIKKLLKPIMDKEADLVIGSRFLNRGNSYPNLIRRAVQKIISSLISLITWQKITDSTSGFRCYTKESISFLNKYCSIDYPEVEEIIFLKKNQFKIKEVGVSTKNREEGVSSFTTIKSLYYLLRVILSIFINILRTPIIKKR